MKCIKKHGEIKRIEDSKADKMVAEEGWSYCPKSEWKKEVRDKA
jgi:hypothetical protein